MKITMRMKTQSVPLKLYGKDENECALTPSLVLKFAKFIIIFIPIYLVASYLGFFVYQIALLDVFFSISWLTTIFSIMTFFWDSDTLRGMIWSIIPGFWIFWFKWFIDWIISLPNPDPVITNRLFISHLPMFLMFTYFMYILRVKHKGTKWWIVMGCTLFWLGYLSIFKLIDDAIATETLNFYHGWFPYQWPLIIPLILLSGIISTTLFYLKEIKNDNKEEESM